MKSFVKIMIVAVVLGSAAVLAYGHWYAPHVQIIQAFEGRYVQVQRGMDEAQVMRICGSDLASPMDWFGDASKPTRFSAWWDAEYDGAHESQRVTHAVRYVVDSPLDKQTYEFTFDGEGKLVGRHCYD